MSFLTFMIGPAVGAVIGGLTNKVAIHMLFRPYQAKYIGRVHIPLTPGIIPKEKPRLAAAIGTTVSDNLLSSEILSATLLSDDIYAKLSSAVDSLQARLTAEEATLESFLLRYVAPDELQRITTRVQDDVAEAAYLRLADKAVGQKVAAMAVEQVVTRLSEGFLGGLKASIVELLRDSIEQKLADLINDMLRQNSRQMVADLLRTETDHAMQKPVKELFAGREELFAQLKSIVLKAYGSLVKSSLPRMLESLNIRRIIENRINEMDMEETERLIISIMDKELKALVWFGVLLGFVMGFVTNLV